MPQTDKELILPALTPPELLREVAGPAVDGFLRVANLWGWTGDERVAALGYSVSRQTLAEWATQPPQRLSSKDQLDRISYLLAIYEGLWRLYGGNLREVAAWMDRPNSDAPFAAHPPKRLLLNGSLLEFARTRSYVEGLVGGPPARQDLTGDIAPATDDLPLPAGIEAW